MRNLTFSSFIRYNLRIFRVLLDFITASFGGISFIDTRFEDTHKAIINPETWEIVQKAREQRHRPTKMGEMGMFSGLTYCADCGAKLYHCRTTSWRHEQEYYTCSTYRGKKGCSAHYIRAVVLEQLVLQNLQRVVAYAQEDEDEFVRRVMENKMALQRTEQEKAKRRRSMSRAFEDCEKVHPAHRADPGPFAGVCGENRCPCSR